MAGEGESSLVLALEPNTYDVVRDDIILEFRDLFLRPPGAGEGDIVLGRVFYRELAIGVWRRARAMAQVESS